MKAGALLGILLYLIGFVNNFIFIYANYFVISIILNKLPINTVYFDLIAFSFFDFAIIKNN